MVFKFAYFVELTKGYQSEKFQCCRLSGASFTEGLQNPNDDCIMMSFHIWGFEISIFCETDYKLSESSFTEVGIKHPKKHYDVIMTSLHNIWFSKLHI